MIRLRHRHEHDEDPPTLHSRQLTLDSHSLPLTTVDNKLGSGKHHPDHHHHVGGAIRRSIQVKARPVLVVVAVWMCGFLVTTALLVYIIPRIEKPFQEYPYLRAKVFNPLRYLHAAYVDQKPKWDKVRTFVMTNETAFVINLESNTQRMTRFVSQNKPSSVEIIQRFSAHEWISSSSSSSSTYGRTTTTTPDEALQKIQLQRQWANNYPFLKISAGHRKFGDAACSLSHLLMWQEKLIDAQKDYIFVFEDDATLLEPLRSSHTIQAPDVVDVVFLAASAVKRVAVAWEQGGDWNDAAEKKEPEPATRVIGGYGALGYIITRQGATKMLEFLKRSRALMDVSLFKSASLRIYLPLTGQWPAVWHDRTRSSSRLGLNDGQ
jgi:GR25 family glycosyltransferase involved in LPS biosynthesis